MFQLLFVLLSGSGSWALTNAQPAIAKELSSVVFYSVAQYDVREKEEVTGFCNGNLVAPHVMITAAHCVYSAEVLNKKVFDMQVGEYFYVTRPDGEVRRVGYAPKIRENVPAKIYLPSTLARRLTTEGHRLRIGPAEDMAVVVFDRPLPLPEGFVFNRPLSQKDVIAVLAKLSSYAPTVVTVNPFEEIATNDTKRMAGLNKISKTMSGYLESNSQSRVQPGDSGAPLFIRTGTEWRQLGVVKGRAQNLFSNWDVYGILDQRLCDISKQIPELAVRETLCH